MQIAVKESGEALRLRRTFQASRQKVFAAWTRREQLEQWMCRDVPSHQVRYTTLDVRPGGCYVMEIPLPGGAAYVGRGKFLEVIEPEKLVFTWSWERVPPKSDEPPETEDSLVTVELFEHGGGTEMVFSHERLRDAESFRDHEKGWNGCFAVLEAYCSM